MTDEGKSLGGSTRVAVRCDLAAVKEVHIALIQLNFLIHIVDSIYRLILVRPVMLAQIQDPVEGLESV